MAEARERLEWSRLAALLATVINTSANRDPRSKPVSPLRLDPYHQAELAKRGRPTVGVEALRCIVTEGERRNGRRRDES